MLTIYGSNNGFLSGFVVNLKFLYQRLTVHLAGYGESRSVLVGKGHVLAVAPVGLCPIQ